MYFQVIVRTTEIGGLSLNNQPVTATWIEIANTNYSAGTISVANSATYTLKHVNEDARFMALLYGSADRESFYFPIDVGMANINVCLLIFTKLSENLILHLKISFIVKVHLRIYYEILNSQDSS